MPADRAAVAPHPGMDFNGFDFSDYFAGQTGAAGSSGGRRPESSAGAGGFRDIFSQFFGGRGGAAESHAEPEKGGDLEYVMDIDFWQAIKGTQARLNITRYEICDHLPWHGIDRARRSHLPAVQRHRQRHADGGGDEV